MNFIEEFIGKAIVKKGLRRLEEMKFLTGYKTYITAFLGIFIVAVGYLFGPVDIAGITIPHIDLDSGVKLVWAALMAIFIRSGVKQGGG
jgi:hypothetical protein